ncbi:hypothetical protein ARTHRO8AJ_450039 [Arthrobacter sp. 8AJ]|nr:hypothetical protein ARTHRO8AJ_450039 [Arthrobacter sp. 8AJ]
MTCARPAIQRTGTSCPWSRRREGSGGLGLQGGLGPTVPAAGRWAGGGDAGLLDAGPATDEVEDQDHHCDNQQNVDQAAANVREQSEKPENGDDDGNPKQHESLLD